MSADQDSRRQPSDVLNCTRKELLMGLEKAHKADILAYSSGHLNHNKLPKLTVPKASNAAIWESSRASSRAANLTSGPQVRLGQKSVDAMARRMKETLCDFTAKTSLTPDVCQSPEMEDLGLHTKRSTPPRTHFRARESLDPFELLLLKPQRTEGISTERSGKDQYRFTPSHLAGLTRKDQFRLMQEFDKEVLKTQDLKERNVMTCHKAAEHHERKLAQELMRVSAAGWSSSSHMKVCSESFTDVCDASPIFREILKEIKVEYDLYLHSVLETQLECQNESLLMPIHGLENRTAMTQEVERARQEVQRLGEAAKRAVEENQQLRNELQIELLKTETLEDEEIPQEPIKTVKQKDRTLSIIERVQLQRRQVSAVWEEVQALEREIKETMVPAVTTSTTESCVRDSEAEVTKLLTSNDHLQRATQDLVNGTAEVLRKMKISADIQEELWTLANNEI
ncbi:uncharacterized protein C6orf118 [Amia ocellicauda]|uniref:uncharacterized protein C6orf118 n=1 Tax=Amia ocellicauda TaxID=2972642 RepID=UPI00346414EF